MNVLHIAPFFWPAVRYGGPIQSVLRLCQEIAAQGIALDVATVDCDGPYNLPVDTSRFIDVHGVRVRYFHRDVRFSFAPSRALTAFLFKHASDYDLVHITSCFSFPSCIAGFAARKAGVPYIVSPRGMLQRWSLGHKRWKKAPYWALIERRHLLRAAGIHATADIEVDDIQAVLPNAPLFVVPNGSDPIAVPDVRRVPRRIVFLGRIHKKKGFDILVPALARVAREMPDVETIVAGPDDGGEWQRVAARIESAEPKPRVTYLGPVSGRAKFELLASASAFVLPSHSENFGMSVVEALACGTPVVVSRNCPWESVEAEGAGYWVENRSDIVADRLLRILRDPSSAERMGHAARAVAKRFAWPSIGQQMTREYERIIAEHRARSGQAPAPAQLRRG